MSLRSREKMVLSHLASREECVCLWGKRDFLQAQTQKLRKSERVGLMPLMAARLPYDFHKRRRARCSAAWLLSSCGGASITVLHDLGCGGALRLQS